MEQNGQLNIVQFGDDNIRFDLINDGQINQFTLDMIEKDREWLEQEVQEQGYSVKDIYIAEYKDGKVVLYPYEKKRRPQIVNSLKAVSYTHLDVYKRQVLDISPTSMIIEVIGSVEKLRGFIQIMETYGILEIAKTGITAMSRGEKM